MIKSALISIFMPLLFSVASFAQQKDTTYKETVHESFEEAPEFPGGMNAYVEFLQKNIRYPRKAIIARAEGTVYISLVIDTSGKVTDAKIKKDTVGYGCGEEGLRVLKLSPRWKPGKINGKPIKVRYTLPIKFHLKE